MLRTVGESIGMYIKRESGEMFMLFDILYRLPPPPTPPSGRGTKRGKCDWNSKSQTHDLYLNLHILIHPDSAV
jgi:hypothetical protein